MKIFKVFARSVEGIVKWSQMQDSEIPDDDPITGQLPEKGIFTMAMPDNQLMVGSLVEDDMKLFLRDANLLATMYTDWDSLFKMEEAEKLDEPQE